MAAAIRSKLEILIPTLINSSLLLSKLRGYGMVIYGGFLRDLAIAVSKGWIDDAISWSQILQLREERGLFNDMDVHLDHDIGCDQLMAIGTMIAEPRFGDQKGIVTYAMIEREAERRKGCFSFEINVKNQMHKVDYTVNALCYEAAGVAGAGLCAKSKYCGNYDGLTPEIVIDHCVRGIAMPFGLFYRKSILKLSPSAPPQFRPSTEKMFNRGYKLDFGAAAALDKELSGTLIPTSFFVTSAILHMDRMLLSCSTR